VKVGRVLWGRGIQATAFPPQEEALLACSAITFLDDKALVLAPKLVSVCTNSNQALATMAAATLMSQTMLLQLEFRLELDANLRTSLERARAVLSVQASQSVSSNLVKQRIVTLNRFQRLLQIQPPSPILLINLKQRSEDAQARALRILSRRQQGYQHVKDLLLTHLHSTNGSMAGNAASALKNYGAQAVDALPALHDALNHPSAAVRSEATNAIGRIEALAKQQ
jgi:hypothetical protein